MSAVGGPHALAPAVRQGDWALHLHVAVGVVAGRSFERGAEFDVLDAADVVALKSKFYGVSSVT